MELVSKGHTVHVLVRNPSASFELRSSSYSHFQGDITDINSVILPSKIASKYTIRRAYKNAGYDRSKFYAINTSGTGNVLEAAYNEGVKKLVLTSSASVFGPSSQYPIQEDDPRYHQF
jgi:nucleoside-diphosphate-sugar epimerase